MLFLLFLKAMAAVLSTNAAIQRLNLDYCGIGDAGVEAWWVFCSRWTCVCLVLSGRKAVAGECSRLRLTMTLLGKSCMNLGIKLYFVDCRLYVSLHVRFEMQAHNGLMHCGRGSV